MGMWPIVGGVYTVSAFGLIEGYPGIYLRELPAIDCPCSKLAGAPWPMHDFKPLDQRKTDIGMLTGLLADA
jgi:hypothetical protein